MLVLVDTLVISINPSTSNWNVVMKCNVRLVRALQKKFVVMNVVEMKGIKL
jgi:hypothetical protein